MPVFPSFAKARNMLVLKELRMANEDKVVATTALLAAAPSTTYGLSGCHSSSSSATGNDGVNSFSTLWGLAMALSGC
ncbi:hypothetical protein E2562_026420 [Oryza meyeriana var. granulata]|uniref:Uncharacterized protein n=1 Tax=Oryza meyeriana var. granulata TaxID=110450 RepID=A0A6G1FCZ8_9ORYZ|nr:hypothetical protein E2562_026420 [Oryza meyeriana var. granulata]